MSKPIPNPYVAHYSKFGRNSGHCVLFRYLIGEQIRFTFVADTQDSKMAKKIARLLNKDWSENNKVEEQHDD
jgi:hypothetical protein